MLSDNPIYLGDAGVAACGRYFLSSPGGRARSSFIPSVTANCIQKCYKGD